MSDALASGGGNSAVATRFGKLIVSVVIGGMDFCPLKLREIG
jgi:hypothetical protein